jgi:hypothetical protein
MGMCRRGLAAWMARPPPLSGAAARDQHSGVGRRHHLTNSFTRRMAGLADKFGGGLRGFEISCWGDLAAYVDVRWRRR